MRRLPTMKKMFTVKYFMAYLYQDCGKRHLLSLKHTSFCSFFTLGDCPNDSNMNTCVLTNFLIYNVSRNNRQPYVQDGEPFLGAVDKLGTAYEDSAIATGLGAYMATPLVRDAVDKGPLDEEAAK